MLGRETGPVHDTGFGVQGYGLAHREDGARAITYPNQREYALTAIQTLSAGTKEQHVYKHTGWRNVNGRWMFLHASGAISDLGGLSDVDVRLTGPLVHYELRSAPAEMLAEAITASLRLIGLVPKSIGYPLLAATYRAVFGGADFALHLAGERGTYKSELAALHQQHFGPRMDHLHLPGAWSSTGNAIEMATFYTKDCLFTVDDFAPHGNSTDVARYHSAADRVFRAVGNQAGRGRLDATARLREPKPPRCLILLTGKDIPRGHSVRARLLILEMPRGAVQTDELTACQRHAQKGLHAAAMTGFIQWLAGRHDEMWDLFKQTAAAWRLEAARFLAHARTPDIVSSLQAAFEIFLHFCEASGRHRLWRAQSSCR